MKFVVSNATPIRYLAEIEVVEILPYLFQRVVIPSMVLQELTHEHTPKIVRNFIVSHPEWLEIRNVKSKDNTLNTLDPGEQEAISLAGEIQAKTILLDDKDARCIAEQKGFYCVGTLGILAEAAKKNKIDILHAIALLKQTKFRAKPQLFQQVIDDVLSTKQFL